MAEDPSSCFSLRLGGIPSTLSLIIMASHAVGRGNGRPRCRQDRLGVGVSLTPRIGVELDF